MNSNRAMDRGLVDTNLSNGNSNLMVVDFKELREEEEEEEEEEEDRETVSLLPQSLNGGTKEKAKKSARRKVQWRDCNGNKLVEILEFQPSDSSDSEEEEDNGWCCCTCSVM